MDSFVNNQNFPEQLSGDYENYKQIIIENKAACEKKIASAKRTARYEEMSGGAMKRSDCTEHQCFVLEKEYSQNAYIHRFRRDDIADKLNLTSNQVRVWFRNRRARKFDQPKNVRRTKENRRPASTPTSIQQPRIQPQQSNSTPTQQLRFQPQQWHSTSIQQPKIQVQLQQSTSINQPVPMFRSSRHLFGTLPYLMGGMSLAENVKSCRNLHHNFSCRCSTSALNRTIEPDVKEYVGPVMSHSNTHATNATSVDYGEVFSHHNMHSTYVPSVDYGDDFFTDYNH